MDGKLIMQTPISFLANFETNSPMNHGGYSNKNYDELLKDSSSKRWQELKKAEKLLINDIGRSNFSSWNSKIRKK